MKAVFDTSVLYAAYVAVNGVCAQAVRLALMRREMHLSEFILDELNRKLVEKANIPRDVVDPAIASLRDGSTIVVPAEVALAACRDPNDLPILGTAIAAGADVLVTGDKDLLTLSSFESFVIWTARQYLDRVTTT